ncbi:MAG: hypothetical protein ACREOM_09280 [Candidatus Dormibacteraceae bacterium]
MKRWLVALLALGLGGAVSAALLILDNPSRDALDVYVAATDIPAGAVLNAASITLARLVISENRKLVFTRNEGGALSVLHASHDLASGQLIQRSDVIASEAPADRRLVFVPVQNAPAAPVGSHIDLLALDGPPDHPTVEPFAMDVEVQSSSSGGLVLVVSAQEAAAFVYAGAAMHLAAVVAEPGSTGGGELPVSSAAQAIQVAGAP